MHSKIHDLIFNQEIDPISFEKSIPLEKMLYQAFDHNNRDARLEVHRILYQINLANFSMPWEKNPINIHHPITVSIKQKIEEKIEKNFIQSHADIVNLKNIDSLIEMIKNHPGSDIHPLYVLLKDTASKSQMIEFFLQETPLEMLFGDIIATLLPGVYGDIKMEILSNYWDELGQNQMERIHRNLRAALMQKLNLDPFSYRTMPEYFLLEELELVNLYLSSATNRSKQLQLIGALLATELSVANGFKYVLAGWQRLGFQDPDLTYFSEHIGIDDHHAEEWLNRVVKPIVQINSDILFDISLGAMRRLSIRKNLFDALHKHIQKV